VKAEDLADDGGWTLAEKCQIFHRRWRLRITKIILNNRDFDKNAF